MNAHTQPTKTSRMNQAIILVLLCFGVGSACNQHTRSIAGNGSTLQAEIGGMDQGDENLTGIKYQILCDSNGTEPILGIINENNRKEVSFPDEKLLIGARCALEVRADIQPTVPEGEKQPIYEWKALKSDGTEDKGLFYSSNYATVEVLTENGKSTKYISFEMIKTYSVAYDDPFIARIPVNFEREEGAVLPQSSGYMANLECTKKDGSGDAKFQEVTTVVAMGDSFEQRLFDFKLSAQKMQNTECSAIGVRINNVPLYHGTFSPIRFLTPEEGATLVFDAVSVDPNQESFGRIRCEERNAAGKCTAINLHEGAELWFAIIRINLNGSERDLVVTPGFGLGISSKTGVETTVKIQSHIAGTEPSEMFSYFEADAALPKLIGSSSDTKDILQAPYTNATPTSIAVNKVAPSEISSAQVLHFNAAYFRGFRTVSEGYLNSFPGGKWFAKTKVSDGNNLVADILIAGGKKYFETINNLRPASSQNAFFTQSEYQRDNTPSDARYRTYVYQGGTWADSCSFSFNDYRRTFGQMTQEQLNAKSADIDACELSDSARLNLLKPNTLLFAPRYYLHGWHAFKFE